METYQQTVFPLLALSLLVALGSVRNTEAAEAPKKPERPKLYDTSADGNKQIAVALKEAQADRKRVIMKFGANW